MAHVEADTAASYTLRTRMAFHWLRASGHEEVYADYLNGEIDREGLYAEVPPRVIRSVINEEIQPNTLGRIYAQIDSLLQGRRLDILVGGPPCQAYSIVGRSRAPGRMLDDKRNYLYRCYAKVLERYRPKRFLFENVVGLLSAKDHNGESYFDAMRCLFRSLGYETVHSVLSAKDYGVPQNRRRVILVGHFKDEKIRYPEPEPLSANLTVNEVLHDLPPLSSGEGSASPCRLRPLDSKWQAKAGIRSPLPVTWHQARPHTEQDLEIYRIAVTSWNEQKSRLKYGDLPPHLRTHKNGAAFQDRFKVVAGDLSFSQTVVAHICKDGHYYIHPSLEQNRSLTPREAARLQTFPDDYYFEGAGIRPSRTHAFRQIGNAVPVLLSRRIATTIREDWNDRI